MVLTLTSTLRRILIVTPNSTLRRISTLSTILTGATWLIRIGTIVSFLMSV